MWKVSAVGEALLNVTNTFLFPGNVSDEDLIMDRNIGITGNYLSFLLYSALSKTVKYLNCATEYKYCLAVFKQ